MGMANRISITWLASRSAETGPCWSAAVGNRLLAVVLGIQGAIILSERSQLADTRITLIA